MREVADNQCKKVRKEGGTILWNEDLVEQSVPLCFKLTEAC